MRTAAREHRLARTDGACLDRNAAGHRLCDPAAKVATQPSLAQVRHPRHLHRVQGCQEGFQHGGKRFVSKAVRVPVIPMRKQDPDMVVVEILKGILQVIFDCRGQHVH